MSTRPRADLAVVGGGPKALLALVALDDALAAGGADSADPAPQALRITLHEPHTPGSGAVWDTTAPDHLIMNVDASIVDVSGVAVEWSYREWERQQGYEARTYPPRNRVGRYLAWAFERLLDSPRLAIEHRPQTVDTVRRVADRWLVGAGPSTTDAAAVLICTGHGGIGPDHRRVCADPATGPGSRVSVVGAALTGIDTVLDLTAGRGGRWSPDADGEDARALGYHPSGAEPALITLLSRSGELLVPKPDPELPYLGRLTDAVREVTGQWPERAAPDRAWWSRFLDAACRGASAAGVTVDRRAVEHTLSNGRAPVPDPMQRWRSDLERASGARLDADPAWWLGRAWSAGYGDVVSSLSRGPRPLDDWRRWRAGAARLERWAFGPPPCTVRRMLALADHGLLRIGTGEPDEGQVLRAITDGPGVLRTPAAPAATAPDSPAAEPPDFGTQVWRSLWDQGLITVRPGERGVLTAPTGHCVDASGRTSQTLAALGRPVEDPVIGHDTLSRALHHDAQRWARATVAHRHRQHIPDRLQEIDR